MIFYYRILFYAAYFSSARDERNWLVKLLIATDVLMKNVVFDLYCI